MRNMSFSMTTDQCRRREKDITRRFGWLFLKPGDRVRAVEKAMGLKKGEKIVEIGIIEIISTRREPLYHITKDDCRREGFPQFQPEDFISMLVHHYHCLPTDVCNRIEFKWIDQEREAA